MWVQTLGWEDPLEDEMAIHSSILSWIIPWTEETGRLQSLGSELDMTEVTEDAWAWPKFSPRSRILSTLQNSLGYSFWITISYIISICFPDTVLITYLLLLRASLKNYYPIFDLHKHIVALSWCSCPSSVVDGRLICRWKIIAVCFVLAMAL